MAKSKERLDADQLIASFRKGKFAPCYLFCGDEKYPVDMAVDVLMETVVDASMREFNVDVVHGNEVDGKRIVSLASAYPMMAERRLVVVKDFDRVNGKDALEPYIEQPSATTVLVLISANPDFRKKPYVTIKKCGYVHESREWYDNETVAWIGDRVKRSGKGIEPAAVQMLHSLVGNNLRELANELEKVAIAQTNGGTVTAADIEKVVGVSREYTSFQLCDRIGEKNMAKALEIAQRMIGSGESVVGLIAAITNHFLRLWKLKDAVQSGKSEQEMLTFVYFNRFALTNCLAQLKQFTAGQIENAFIALAEADLAAKSSGDPRTIITMLITEIVTGAPVRSGAAAG